MSDRENSPDAWSSGSPSPQEESISYSRSRSRSRSHSFRRRISYSRSSQSYSPRRSYSPEYSPRHFYYDDKYYSYGGKGNRSVYNRSPMSSHRRNFKNRDNPEPSRCLAVFGLSPRTQERELRKVFEKYGPLEEVQVVYDSQIINPPIHEVVPDIENLLLLRRNILNSLKDSILKEYMSKISFIVHTFKKWNRDREHEKNFMFTQATPSIAFMPKRLTDMQKKMMEANRKEIDDEISYKREVTEQFLFHLKRKYDNELKQLDE